MLPAPVRLLIIAALVIPSIYGFANDKTRLAAGLLAVALLQVYAYFRYASVPAAGKAYRAQNHERAWRLLEQTPLRGRLLRRSIRAYYHLLRSSCLLDREEWAAVPPEAEVVLSLTGIAPENRAAAHSALARAALGTGDLPAAREHVAAARALPCNPGLVRLLARIEEQVADGAANVEGDTRN